MSIPLQLNASSERFHVLSWSQSSDPIGPECGSYFPLGQTQQSLVLQPAGITNSFLHIFARNGKENSIALYNMFPSPSNMI